MCINLGANTSQHSGYKYRKGEKGDGADVRKLNYSYARDYAI